MPKLKKITINPNHLQFMYLDNTFIIGKSKFESYTYEILYFARRDIKIAKNPLFIKIIGSNSFSDCTELKTLNISENIELQY